MQIQWTKRGGRRALALAAALLAAALQLVAARWTGGRHMSMHAAMALPLGALTFVAFGGKVTVRRWWGMLIELFCIAGASAVILHLPLFHWTSLSLNGFARAVCLGAVLLSAVFIITANLKWFGAFWLTFSMAFGLIDAAVIQFSGNIITANDITAIGTAANVAARYTFKIMPLMITQLVLYAACMVVLLRAREVRPELKRLRVRLVALVCLLATAAYPAYTLKTKKPNTWKTKGIRLNSALMELLLEAKMIRVRPPKGYSTEALAGLSEKYPAREASVEGDKRPHVIAVMIEAFSDLRVLGDFETDVDYMPYTRELMKASVSGTALVSTFGGGTARSEWEFLTGNSMGFLPGGSMPFRQYMGSDENSIVRVFKNAGYHTVGMHPFKANGWGRNKVYPALGFDDVYFIDDLAWDEYVRGFVSDRAFVHQVIHLFENRDRNAPMFFFGVTIQNHSDYYYEDYAPTVHLQGLDRDYPAVEQYLSLILETDGAIRELIEYFSACDEPVQIVLFGDHEPATGSGFRSAVGVKNSQQRYQVPFVMWDNYEHRVEAVPLTSVNYLPARLLDLAGIQKPSFYCMLSEVSQTVEAMNQQGCFVNGRFCAYSGKDSPEAAALLNDYRFYQYGNMFDRNADRTLFIGAGTD